MEEKVAIVTGGSRGIGRSILQKMLEKGWRCINLSRHSSGLEGACDVVCDLSQAEFWPSISNYLFDLLAKKPRVCLVHNSWSYLQDSLSCFSQQPMLQSFQVGVVAPSILNEKLLPYMGERSSILYIGSTLSERAVAGAYSYTICKHAVCGMMRATCQDLKDFPSVHTCCIAPGFTETEMLKEHIKDKEVYDSICQRVSANRIIQPEEIASLVSFCSDNPVVNGSFLHAHLGQLEK